MIAIHVELHIVWEELIKYMIFVQIEESIDWILFYFLVWEGEEG